MLYPNFNDLLALKGRKSGLMHPSFRAVKSAVPGNYHSPFRGQGLEFDSVREYVPGDDIRSIDWRVTARTASPHLKIFKEDRERHITICVDMNAAMRFGTKNTFKSVQAAHVAAFLGWQAIAQHDRLSLCLFGDVPGGIQIFPPKQSKKSFGAALKMISEPPTEEHEIRLEDALKLVSQTAQSGSLIYLVSDFMNMTPGFQDESGLNRLSKKCDIIFVSINDQSDRTIYPMGLIGFYKNNKEKVYLDTKNSKGYEAYAAQWKSNRQQLDEITSKFKIPLIALTTESDICRDLVFGLKSIVRGKRR